MMLSISVSVCTTYAKSLLYVLLNCLRNSIIIHDDQSCIKIIQKTEFLRVHIRT